VPVDDADEFDEGEVVDDIAPGGVVPDCPGEVVDGADELDGALDELGVLPEALLPEAPEAPEV
jgi:hypothetical protein